ADLGELGRLLIDIDLEAGPAQRQCGSQTTDAATDHRDPERCVVHPDLTESTRRCQPLKEGLSRGGSADLGAADEVDKVIAIVLRRSAYSAGIATGSVRAYRATRRCRSQQSARRSGLHRRDRSGASQCAAP